MWLLNADSVSGALKYLNSCKEPVNSTPKSPNEPVEPKNTSPLAVHCPLNSAEADASPVVEPLKSLKLMNHIIFYPHQIHIVLQINYILNLMLFQIRFLLLGHNHYLILS